MNYYWWRCNAFAAVDRLDLITLSSQTHRHQIYRNITLLRCHPNQCAHAEPHLFRGNSLFIYYDGMKFLVQFHVLNRIRNFTLRCFHHCGGWESWDKAYRYSTHSRSFVSPCFVHKLIYYFNKFGARWKDRKETYKISERIIQWCEWVTFMCQTFSFLSELCIFFIRTFCSRILFAVINMSDTCAS